MGITALKPVLEILKTDWEIDEKPLKNKNLHIMVFVNISEKTQYFRILIFVIGWYFNWKKIKNSLLHFFFECTYIFLRNFSTIFVDFSVSFQYFLKWVSALKFPLIATEYYAYNSVSSVESIKILAIIVKAKMGQNGRRMHNLLSNYLIKLCFIYRLQS